MATNNLKFNYFGIVLNAPKEKATHEQASDFFNATLSALKNYNKCKFFASAIHDQDKHEDGTAKTIHCHIELETFEKMTNLGALRDFCNATGVDKGLVSINGSNNLFLLVQYLTHKNDQDKHQYDYDVIKTNNAELCANLYNADYESKDDQLMRALREANTINDFMQIVGPSDANKYRGLFKDMKIEQHQDFQGVLDRAIKTKHEYEALYHFVDDLLITLQMSLRESEKRMINLDRYVKVLKDNFIKPI